MGPCKLRQYLSQLNWLKFSKNLCNTWHPQQQILALLLTAAMEQSVQILADNSDLTRGLQLLMVNVEDV